MRMFNFNGYKIPDHTKTALIEYIEQGAPVSGFLHAVLTNNLRGAIESTDLENLHYLKDVADWLYMYAPEACAGTDAKYLRWINEQPKRVIGPKDLA